MRLRGTSQCLFTEVLPSLPSVGTVLFGNAVAVTMRGSAFSLRDQGERLGHPAYTRGGVSLSIISL